MKKALNKCSLDLHIVVYFINVLYSLELHLKAIMKYGNKHHLLHLGQTDYQYKHLDDVNDVQQFTKNVHFYGQANHLFHSQI